MDKEKSLKTKKSKTKIIFLVILLLFFFYTMAVKVFPRKYIDFVEKYSNEYNIEKSLIYSVISVESGFREDAKSEAGAIGLMQITEDTGEFIASKININNYHFNDLFDPDLNIKMGTYYLMYLGELFDNEDKILASYNAGPNRVRIWINEGVFNDKSSIPYGETDRYIKKVERRKVIYKILYFFDNM